MALPLIKPMLPILFLAAVMAAFLVGLLVGRSAGARNLLDQP